AESARPGRQAEANPRLRTRVSEPSLVHARQPTELLTEPTGTPDELARALRPHLPGLERRLLRGRLVRSSDTALLQPPAQGVAGLEVVRRGYPDALRGTEPLSLPLEGAVEHPPQEGGALRLEPL